MKISSFDKTAGGILRSFGKGGIKPEARRKLEVRFQKLTASTRRDVPEALNRAFEQSRYHWHESTRLPVNDYGRTVRDLIQSGYPLAAAGMFVACVDSFSKLELGDVAPLMPNAGCADAWVKAKKANRKSIQKAVAARHESFYESAVADWFIAKAPIKSTLSFARLALKQRPRPAHLPGGSEMLGAILKRDRKSVLGDALAREALESAAASFQLISAAVTCPRSMEPIARSLGNSLATASDESSVVAVVEALGVMVRDDNSGVARMASQMGAHVATTWRLVAGSKVSASSARRLQELAAHVLTEAQANASPDLWVACPAGLLSETMAAGPGKVSAQGALEVALALRSAQTGADAGDALWSFATNFGLREIGARDERVAFDPQVHEDVKGGLLRDDSARVVRCGWEFEGRVLVRAQVEPV